MKKILTDKKAASILSHYPCTRELKTKSHCSLRLTEMMITSSPYWHLTGRQIQMFSSKLAWRSKSARSYFPNCIHKTHYFWSSKYWMTGFAPQKTDATSWITKLREQSVIVRAVKLSNPRIPHQPDFWGRSVFLLLK